MDIIDIHTHSYPRPEIGRQAMQGEGWSPYAGTVPELREAMTRGGIGIAVMANLTPVPDMRDAALARLPGRSRPPTRRCSRSSASTPRS
ncbi:MAG: hypothetical protein HYV62_16160 [Candidatus Rokubacteria bacterium]|nr:hypothetical protein [Candidatus Rokubacteria bacterium]